MHTICAPGLEPIRRGGTQLKVGRGTGANARFILQHVPIKRCEQEQMRVVLFNSGAGTAAQQTIVHEQEFNGSEIRDGSQFKGSGSKRHGGHGEAGEKRARNKRNDK